MKTPHSAPSTIEFDDVPGVDGRNHSLSSLAGARATVVVFISNGCPTVRSYEDRLMAMARAWQPSGVELIAINPNNASLSPPDTFDQMIKRSSTRAYNFPYLKMRTGQLRAIMAPCALRMLSSWTRITALLPRADR